MKILLIYHFFYPDTVISARLFSDLAMELAKDKQNQVTVFTGNRIIRSDEILTDSELWAEVEIRRFSRPNFSQGSNFGRLFNSAILQLKWLLAFRKMRKNFDSVIVGTDPQFDYMMFPFFKLMNRKIKLIHWAFDLYPEAILVNSPKWMKLLASFAKPFAKIAYKNVDVMVDIGSCMRERLKLYDHKATCVTLPPWALVEPKEVAEVNAEVRSQLFGNAKLGLLYSGTVGYAHDLLPFIELARACRQKGLDIAFCFAGYGNCYKEQTAILTEEDTNIRIAGFASEEELELRLSAADIHMISLREGWEGVVVPSKFFGALAIGRPILFSGSSAGSIVQYCQNYNIGYQLNDNTINELELLLNNLQKLENLKQNAFKAYSKYFSKKVIIKQFNNLIKMEQ